MKTPIVIKPEYTLYLEHFDGVFWVHMDVYSWTPKVKRRMLEELNKIRDLVTMPLRALVVAENLKLKKFCICLGCDFEFEITLPNGSKALIYKWS